MGDTGVIHIVQFQFKEGTSESDKQNVAHEVLALKDRCLGPETGKPYIKSLTGGKNNSPEGINDGLEYAFVVEFENTEDRDYYVFKDPAHDSFKALGGPKLEKAVVVDYNKGLF
ncbi:hypothetical protein VMCG_04244 [Cytospora schulzeri]|uniref:Stress-response A/B barrel domain-containing protein n=1 Tax=Cytospora schulzeri TaxID=448051 RepID=A0A423WTP0_9PEZI|nr:hypothetical protein VMCG_04244 [Valsa malicola]